MIPITKALKNPFSPKKSYHLSYICEQYINFNISTMNICKKLTAVTLLFYVLCCCAAEESTHDKPGSTPENGGVGADEEESLVIRPVVQLGEAADEMGLGFEPGDEIGVYLINEEGLSLYNVCFSTQDGKSFTQPQGRSLSYGESTKVYAYYPYVKDASKTLVKDVKVPMEQSGEREVKPMLFYAASGRVVDHEAVLDFVPVQSIVNLKLHNATPKEISLTDISLEFKSYAAGIFRHNLENNPLSEGFSLEPLSGTTSFNVSLKGESPYLLASGKNLELQLVLAPMQSSEVKLKGYAGDGDWWKVDLQVEDGLLSGKLTELETKFSPANYSFDVHSMIADMNLLEDSDYSVPDKHYKKRMLYPGGVLNCRDFGGIPLENGGVTASGVIFRSAALEDVTPEGKKYMRETLGIKTDIDLRDSSTGEAKGYSPLGEDIYYFNRLGPWYALGADGIKEGSRRGNLLEILQKFADKNNYPLVFHCQVGRDRAGTVAAVLASLAGVTMKGLYEDYLISFYASCCHGGIYYASGQVHNIIQMYEFLSTYKSAELSLSENTIAFLLDLGLTQSEIDTIKDVLLTGNVSC